MHDWFGALTRVGIRTQDRLSMAHSLEVRVPFLDADFLDVALNMDPQWKLHKNSEGRPRIEKWAFRSAFEESGYLPSEVLWRKKEQFGDGE